MKSIADCYENNGSQDQNILTKTQNIQLGNLWVYDCLFSKLEEGIKIPNQSQNEKQQMNGHCHNSENNGKAEQHQIGAYRVLACTKQGKLIEFEKSTDGIIKNNKNLFQAPSQEEFFRLFQDCDSIDYQNRYLLMCGSRKRVHVFKLFQQNNESQVQEQEFERELKLNKVTEYIPAPDKNVYGLCGFKKHSNKVLSSGQFNITIYDMHHQKIVRRIKNDIENATVEYNRDFNVFSTCGISKNVLVYDDRQNKHIFSLKGHSQNVVRLSSLKDNKQFFLASGSHDQSIILWDIRYQQNNKIIHNHHQNTIFGLDYDQQNQILYSSSWDKSIKALELKTFSTIGHISCAQQDKIITCRFNSTTQELMTSSRDGSIQFYSSQI